MTVVDASVFVASQNPAETCHEASARWWQRMSAEGRSLSAPTIILPEVASAIMRATADEGLVARLVTVLRTGPLLLEPVTESLAARAAEIAATHGLRGCDAVYVALAERLGEDLVTFDPHQLEHGAALVPTTTPGADRLVESGAADGPDSRRPC